MECRKALTNIWDHRRWCSDQESSKMEENTNLCLQLHKLSGIKSEEELEGVLTLIWKTRKTGLNNAEKSSLQSVFSLPSAAELDLVLVCLRSIIRKIAHESFAGPDIMKLFPSDFPVDLQSMLVKLLQKYQNQWQDELAKEKHMPGTTKFLDRVNIGFQPPLAFHSPEISALLWPCLDDSVSQCDNNIQGACSPVLAESNVSLLQQPLLANVDASDKEGVVPHLKSMTWTLESQNTTRTDKAAIVSLKLQDYTKSPLGEIEVKFRLKQDTLEAVIRSLAYISEQLSKKDESSLEPLQKKQRQGLISTLI